MARLIAALALASLLAACNTTSTPAPVAQAQPGMATIVVKRSSDLYALAAPVAVDLNGGKIADLGIGQSHTLAVPPGQLRLSVSVWSSPGRSSIVFKAEPNKTYQLVASPRGAYVVAGAIGGMAGIAADTAMSENSGPYTIAMVSH